MRATATGRPRAVAAESFSHASGRAVLRRTCACGGTPGVDGECAACRVRRIARRAAAGISAPAVAPPIVHDVLRDPGRPVDAGTRRAMESRLVHDFGDVRIHEDERAGESARAVHASAYTVGRDIVFGPGRYAPQTHEGRKLLAHELVHVVQQRGTTAQPGAPLAVGPPDGALEREARSGAARAGRHSAQAVLQRQEELTQVWRVGPLDALSARSDAKKALADTGATGLAGAHNGPADAWRHCYWNCLMTDSIGADQARTVADTHEELGGNPRNETDMDLLNNAAGRSCGVAGRDCWACCMTALSGSDLRIIPDWSGPALEAPVPSGAPATPTGAATGAGYRYYAGGYRR